MFLQTVRVQLISTVRVNGVKDFSYVLALREIHCLSDKDLVEVTELRDNID